MFNLTKSPFCSSTLEPDPPSLVNWLYSDLFVVEKQATVPATTIDSLMSRLSLDGIDWFKIDSQGTDLRLFNSIAPEVRSRVLALDIEPGLIEVYKDEDLFVEVHQELTRNGFWLSRVDIGGFIRKRRATLDAARCIDSRIDESFIKRAVRPSPAYCEARYLRTIEWLAQNNLSQHEYVLLWIFAVLDDQLGFALDLSIEFGRVFGDNDISRGLKRDSCFLMKKAYRYRQARSAPATVKRRLIRLSRHFMPR
jgi:hypothetical protein